MTLWDDGRRIGRRLLATPLFTLVTLLTLAVGIGANTAIFSVVYGVVLRPLPFAEPGRLVSVWHEAPGMGIPLLNQGPATYFTYRESGRVFTDIGLWQENQVSITGRAEPERVRALYVTDGVLPLLGVQPVVGRLITRQDDSPKTPTRGLLTYAYWQQRYGGSRDVVGRTITVEGESCEVIGVLPASFKFLNTSPSLVLPLQFNRADVFVGNFSFMGIARLKPGVTIAQANADIARMLPLVPERFPLPPGFTLQMLQATRMGPKVRPLADDVVGDTGRILWILLGTVGIVLLIACANVANLFLVRAEGRQQELAVRTALGASPRRIARDLLAESVLLALCGGAIGVVLAQAGITALARIAPSGLPRVEEIGIDPVVLLFTVAISVVAGLLFGLLPVYRFRNPSVAALKEGGRSVSEGRDRHRARNVLVVAEIAMALTLLIVSGLMVRTFVALRGVEPGFTHPEQVQTFRISIPEALVKDPAQVVLLERQIAERVRALPGVSAVGITTSVTMDGYNNNDPVFVETHPDPAGRMAPIRRYKSIGPGYLETMGNRLVAGRTLTWEDALQARPVVVINETLARAYWPTPAAALGQRVRNTPQNPWREVVGVVGDERDNGLNEAAPAIIYWPLLIKDFWKEPVIVRRDVAFVVRSDRVETPGFMRELQQAVWGINSALPLADVRTLDAIRAASMAQTAFALWMLGIAAAVALLLGVVGIYGIIAYIVTQRTREIGIRIALGAQRADVSRLFLRHGLALTAVGVTVGIALSLASTRLLSSLLYGVNATNPATYVAVSVGLAAVALLATWLPARRAAGVDPMVALRADG